jgi:hypothetical protein
MPEGAFKRQFHDSWSWSRGKRIKPGDSLVIADQKVRKRGITRGVPGLDVPVIGICSRVKIRKIKLRNYVHSYSEWFIDRMDLRRW